MVKTIWLNCDNRKAITTREELDNLRETLIQCEMEDYGTSREEAEEIINSYMEDNIPEIEINPDESNCFYVDYDRRTVLSEEEVMEEAQFTYPFDDWIDETYSAYELFQSFSNNGIETIYDKYNEEIINWLIDYYDLDLIETLEGDC